MNRHPLAAAIDRELASRGTPDRAVGAKAYLKSDLKFYGVAIPELRRTVLVCEKAAPVADRSQLLAVVDALWRTDVFELRTAAVELLIKRANWLVPDDLARLERMVRESKTWALVDAIAPAVVGPLIVAYPATLATLDRWATDDDFWVRRAAMLALLVPLRHGGGDFARFGRYADAQLGDHEFFIRKAIGWILRETARKRPQLVYDWLLPRAARAAGLTVREATRHLPAQQRDAILAAHRAAKPAAKRAAKPAANRAAEPVRKRSTRR